MAKWVQDFLSKPESRYFVRIDEEFLANSFNVYGLKQKVSHFAAAYELLRRNKFNPRDDPNVTLQEVSAQAEILYGLLHARFIITKPGLHLMLEKYQKGEFQTCPRVFCRGTQCLPYGIADEPGKERIKMYCPCCCDIYNVTAPELAEVDGAYFGPSWVHMFLHKHRQLVPKDPPRVYVPKIFGFRICHASDAETDTESDSEN